MVGPLRRLIAPPSFAGDEDRARAAAVPNTLIWALVARSLMHRGRVAEAGAALVIGPWAIYDPVDEAVFVHDMESGAILDVNRKMTEMFGWSREEALRLTVGDISSGAPGYAQKDALERIRQGARGESRVFEWQGRHGTAGSSGSRSACGGPRLAGKHEFWSRCATLTIGSEPVSIGHSSRSSCGRPRGSSPLAAWPEAWPTFDIYLPRVAGDGRPLPPEPPSGEVPAGSETVLLVEDEPAVRDVARQVLSHLGPDRVIPEGLRFLAKPFTPQALALKVRAALDST